MRRAIEPAAGAGTFACGFLGFGAFGETSRTSGIGPRSLPENPVYRRGVFPPIPDSPDGITGAPHWGRKAFWAAVTWVAASTEHSALSCAPR